MSACPKCDEDFNAAERIPKVLPCGHTACLRCLEEDARASGKLCPTCRKVFKAEPIDLVDNLHLIDPGFNASRRMWCTRCDAEALAACYDDAAHSLQPLRRLERDAEAELRDALALQVGTLRRLAEAAQVWERQIGVLAANPMLGDTSRRLVALRERAAAVQVHPLYLFRNEDDDLLPRALIALKNEVAVMQVVVKEDPALAEDRAALEAVTETVKRAEIAVMEREIALQEKEAALQEKEAALQREEENLQAARAAILLEQENLRSAGVALGVEQENLRSAGDALGVEQENLRSSRDALVVEQGNLRSAGDALGVEQEDLKSLKEQENRQSLNEQENLQSAKEQENQENDQRNLLSSPEALATQTRKETSLQMVEHAVLCVEAGLVGEGQLHAETSTWRETEAPAQEAVASDTAESTAQGVPLPRGTPLATELALQRQESAYALHETNAVDESTELAPRRNESASLDAVDLRHGTSVVDESTESTFSEDEANSASEGESCRNREGARIEGVTAEKVVSLDRAPVEESTRGHGHVKNAVGTVPAEEKSACEPAPVKSTTGPVLTTPGKKSASKTFPVKESASKAFPVKKSASKAFPVKKSASQTFPVKKSASKTFPVKKSVSQTLPVRESASKTFPVQKSASKTFPVKKSASKTLPVKEGASQTIPEKESASQTFPVKNSANQTAKAKPSVGDKVPRGGECPKPHPSSSCSSAPARRDTPQSSRPKESSAKRRLQKEGMESIPRLRLELVPSDPKTKDDSGGSEQSGYSCRVVEYVPGSKRMFPRILDFDHSPKKEDDADNDPVRVEAASDDPPRKRGTPDRHPPKLKVASGRARDPGAGTPRQDMPVLSEVDPLTQTLRKEVNRMMVEAAGALDEEEFESSDDDVTVQRSDSSGSSLTGDDKGSGSEWSDDGEEDDSGSSLGDAPAKADGSPDSGEDSSSDEADGSSDEEGGPSEAEVEAPPKRRKVTPEKGVIHALPDEILVKVFSMVPTPERAEELLALRLVCRRWADLGLHAAVWRHRSVTVTSGEPAAYLRLLPALDTLTLRLDRSDDRSALLALARGSCQIRHLVLKVYVTAVASKLIAEVIMACQSVLESLELDLRPHRAGSNPEPILKAVDQLPSLRLLSIDGGDPVSPLCYKFRGLKALQVFRAHELLPRTFVNGILAASSRTLIVADCPLPPIDAPDARDGDGGVLRRLSKCGLLREVMVHVGGDLHRLHGLAHLKTLNVHCSKPGHLQLLKEFLDHPQLVLTTVRVHLDGSSEDPEYTLADASLSFAKVKFLEVRARTYLTPTEFLSCLSCMPRLEVLALHGTRFVAKLATGLSQYAPRLRVLHVHQCKSNEEWVPKVKNLCPKLKICTSASCKYVY